MREEGEERRGRAAMVSGAGSGVSTEQDPGSLQPTQPETKGPFLLFAMPLEEMQPLISRRLKW